MLAVSFAFFAGYGTLSLREYTRSNRSGDRHFHGDVEGKETAEPFLDGVRMKGREYMELEREPNPILETLSALLEERPYGLVMSLFVIPVMLITVLWLPPISLGERVLYAGYSYIAADGGSVNDPDGTQVTFLSEGMDAPIRAKMTSAPRVEFVAGNVSSELRAAASAMPSQLAIKSPVYQVVVRGNEPDTVAAAVPIPNDAEPYTILDLYEWDGEKWAWMPHKLYPEDEQLESRLDHVPETFAVFQAQRAAPVLGVEVDASSDFLGQAGVAPTEVSPRLYIVNGDGRIGQLSEEPAGLRESGAVVIPVLHNEQDDGVIRSDLTDNLLIQEDVWRNHVGQIVALVVQRNYAGIEIDYRNVDPELRAEFTTFIQTLAGQLHEQGKLLVVRVPTPQRIAEDRFDSGAYDLEALGRAADQVRLMAPIRPEAWHSGGDAEALLTWTTGKVNRYKLELVLPVASYDVAGERPQPIAYRDVLSALGDVRVELPDEVAEPGQQVRLIAEALDSGSTTFDPEAQVYQIAYRTDSGTLRRVQLENAASFAHKLQLVAQYNVGGIALADAAYADPRIWTVLARYQQGDAVEQVENRFALIWKVRNERGEQIINEVQSVEAGEYLFTIPDETGTYRVALAVSDDGGATTYGSAEEQAIVVPTYTPTPAATPTPTPTATPEPTNTPEPEPVQATSQESEMTASASTTQQETSAAPPPSSPPASTASGGGLKYGIQAHMIHQDKNQIMRWIQGMGFGWVKQQIEWKVFEPAAGQIQWGEMDAIINAANAHGIKVLFSIVKAPPWAREPGFDKSVEGPPQDPNTYANFVRNVAARYCGKGLGAIEVWNEQNLHYEWGNKPLSAAEFMNLMRVAYTAIKQACPSMVVVSGALTPAGNVAGRAIDDIQYLQQMYNNGLRQYSDAIGAHPSGYNCPATGDWRTITDPNASFRGPFENRHHSWCFRGTMEGYRTVMVQNGDSGKAIWPTEFGWAVGPAVNNDYGYANDTTIDEQATWTVQAYQMARNWGWVGGMFLWNLNFKVVSPGSEQAQWGIIDEFGQPTATYHALAGMAK